MKKFLIAAVAAFSTLFTSTVMAQTTTDVPGYMKKEFGMKLVPVVEGVVCSENNTPRAAPTAKFNFVCNGKSALTPFGIVWSPNKAGEDIDFKRLSLYTVVRNGQVAPFKHLEAASNRLKPSVVEETDKHKIVLVNYTFGPQNVKFQFMAVHVNVRPDYDFTFLILDASPKQSLDLLQVARQQLANIEVFDGPGK